jgi:hypothetical protein
MTVLWLRRVEAFFATPLLIHRDPFGKPPCTIYIGFAPEALSVNVSSSPDLACVNRLPTRSRS